MRVKTSTSWLSARLWRQTRRNAPSWRKPCDVSYVFFPQVCLWYIISLRCFTSWYSLQQEYFNFMRWGPSPVVHSNFDYSTSTSNFWMISETKIYFLKLHNIKSITLELISYRHCVAGVISSLWIPWLSLTAVMTKGSSLINATSVHCRHFLSTSVLNVGKWSYINLVGIVSECLVFYLFIF